ncbi:MAG: FixH family protein [Thiothrix sp.]|uniref:FixH family protein n=1 Tax=Thiothrix sp. TaxID=1032 RepID=UPI00261AE1D9|nr:FixH family protein [Thiothrix sp.]MDD5392624.1 FixH family protein [Thiothrix sp.]
MRIEDTKPWYKQVWPWILIALPGSVVVASLYTYRLAALTSSGLVVDDYYKAGLAINDIKEHGQKAQSLGLTAKLSVSGKSLQVLLNKTDVAKGETLRMKFSHATFPQLDQAVMLAQTADGFWSGQFEPLAPGKWYVYLSAQDESWRLSGMMHEADMVLDMKPDL